MNSRYRFKPVYSLSRRAPSADSDTSPRATDAAAPRMQKRNLAQDRIPVKRMNIIIPHLIAPGGGLRSAAAPHHRPAGRSAPHSTASTCPHTTDTHNRPTQPMHTQAIRRTHRPLLRTKRKQNAPPASPAQPARVRHQLSQTSGRAVAEPVAAPKGNA